MLKGGIKYVFFGGGEEDEEEELLIVPPPPSIGIRKIVDKKIIAQRNFLIEVLHSLSMSIVDFFLPPNEMNYISNLVFAFHHIQGVVFRNCCLSIMINNCFEIFFVLEADIYLSSLSYKHLISQIKNYKRKKMARGCHVIFSRFLDANYEGLNIDQEDS